MVDRLIQINSVQIVNTKISNTQIIGSQHHSHTRATKAARPGREPGLTGERLTGESVALPIVAVFQGQKTTAQD